MFNLYLIYLLIVKGVPRKIVADWGTENVNIAGSQRFLRQNHSDNLSGYHSFQFGESITNQRMEFLVSATSLMYRLVDSLFQRNSAWGNIR